MATINIKDERHQTKLHLHNKAISQNYFNKAPRPRNGTRTGPRDVFIERPNPEINPNIINSQDSEKK
jgi:hypothetical protein